MVLFFTQMDSWHALHRNCPLTQTKCWFGCTLILSYVEVLDNGFVILLALYLPEVLAILRSLEIEALSSSESSAPFSIAI